MTTHCHIHPINTASEAVWSSGYNNKGNTISLHADQLQTFIRKCHMAQIIILHVCMYANDSVTALFRCCVGAEQRTQGVRRTHNR